MTAAGASFAQDRWRDVGDGVRALHRRTQHADGARLEMHVALVDLCAGAMRVRATAPNETPMQTSRWARRVGARVAINGDFFDRPGVPLGRARGDGVEFAPRSTYYFGALVAAMRGDVPRVLERYEAPAQYTEVVSAQERIVVRGVARVDPHVNHSRQRHPRSALGWSRDGRTLALVVVDGRSSRSAGATTPELALILRDLGAWEAVRLDGGGSSTLVIDETVVNAPSDGHERAVANHLGWVRDRAAPRPAVCREGAPSVDVAQDPPRDEMPFPTSARPARIRAVLGSPRPQSAAQNDRAEDRRGLLSSRGQ